jgi:hypothetical protein
MFKPKNIKIIGEAASADEKAAVTFLEELKKLSRWENTIQASFQLLKKRGLFWKKMHVTYSYTCKSAKQVPGFQAWKDRLTLVLCGNTAWRLLCKQSSHYEEQIYKKKNYALFWQHNLKAWVTTVLFTKWSTNAPSLKSRNI